MRRLLVILVALFFVLGATGNTPHRDAKACFAIKDGLDRAADLGWINDASKAAQLRPSYDTLRNNSAQLAKVLEEGASVETTKQLEDNLTNAGMAFMARANELRVQFPSDLLHEYLDYVKRCSQPY